MRHGTARERGMLHGQGERAERDERGNRAQSATGTDREPDLETQIEEEMAASGRTSVRPRAGLVGAHEQRNASLAASAEVDEPGEPVGAGSDVAPTRWAERREKERHQLEQQVGVFAGSDESPRQRRSPGVTREALDRVNEQADRNVLAEVAVSGDPNRTPAPGQRETGWQERAGDWLRDNRKVVMGMSGVAVAAACLLASSRRR